MNLRYTVDNRLCYFGMSSSFGMSRIHNNSNVITHLAKAIAPFSLPRLRPAKKVW